MNRMIPRFPRRNATGSTLVVVLILLLVMTLLGLTVIRSTLLEERMSANLYDRSLAFQSTEFALRQAEEAIKNSVLNSLNIGYNCSPASGNACAAIPSNAFTGNIAGCAAGTSECWTTAPSPGQALAVGAPQYYIQYMGQRDSTDALGLGDSANMNQYGGGGGIPLESFYRVTARSNDPSIALDRAVVVLQTTVTVK